MSTIRMCGLKTVQKNPSFAPSLDRVRVQVVVKLACEWPAGNGSVQKVTQQTRFFSHTKGYQLDEIIFSKYPKNAHLRCRFVEWPPAFDHDRSIRCGGLQTENCRMFSMMTQMHERLDLVKGWSRLFKSWLSILQQVHYTNDLKFINTDSPLFATCFASSIRL